MNIWNIAAKDLLLLVRDRRALVVLVALPLVFIAIIGMSTGKMLGWRNRNETLRLAVVDNSGATESEPAALPAADGAPPDGEGNLATEEIAGPADNAGETTDLALRRITLDELSPEIVNRLKRHKGMEVTVVPTISTARALLADEKYTAVIVFGPEFRDRVDGLKEADVFDGEGSGLATDLGTLDVQMETPEPPTNGSALSRLIVHNEVYSVVVPFVLKKNPARAREIEHAVRVRRRAREQQADEQPAGKSKLDLSGQFGSVVYQKVVPSYTVMFAFFLVTLMSRSFLTERELGTYRRLKTTPVSPTALILGKIVPYFLISLVQSALLFVFGRLLFGMSWGEKPWLLFPVVFATSAAATGLGMLIATIVRTEAQVTSVAMLVVLAMAGVSGCFTPRDWLPEAMQTMSLATPHAWALIAYDQILSTSHPDVRQVWRCCGWLMAFAAGYFGLGLWRFRSVPV
ncbi:MAG: ABC transporter permease [Planctomycetaceae bacterium]|nr:ABC transporter permease [Planctomycetaceae bacterium]